MKIVATVLAAALAFMLRLCRLGAITTAASLLVYIVVATPWLLLISR